MSETDKMDKSNNKTRYVYFISTIAAIGGLLFGYDTAVIAGAIGFIETKFQLSPAMTGWAASSAIWGCVFGAMSAGYLSDKWEEKDTYFNCFTIRYFSYWLCYPGHAFTVCAR